MDALTIYNDAFKITDVSPLQKSIFNYCAEQDPNAVENFIAFDTETTGLTFGEPSWLHYNNTEYLMNNVFPFGMSFCMKYYNEFAVVWARHGTPLWDECIKLLKTKSTKVMHNARFDLRVCAVNDIKFNGKFYDTLTMARLYWNRRKEFGLKDLTYIVAPEMYGYDDNLKAILKNIKSSYTRSGKPPGYANYSFIPDEIIGEYAMIDAFVTWLLNYHLYQNVQGIHKDVFVREHEIIRIVLGLELRGQRFDRNTAKRYMRKLEVKIPRLTDKLCVVAEKHFNPNSPMQLKDTLLSMGVKTKELTRNKKVTTDKEQLLKVLIKKNQKKRIIKFIETLLDLRSCSKILGTYLKPLYERAQYSNGIIYGNINPTDTRTGRMASNNPNLQNIPRPTTGTGGINPVRQCFIPRYGFNNYYLDYSNMEMWLFAIEAQEDFMLQSLLHGADIHATVAYDIFGQDSVSSSKGEERIVLVNGKLRKVMMLKEYRHKAKGVNFGIIYGMGFKALAQFIKIPEIEAYDLREKYLNQYPRITEYLEENTWELKKHGYVQDLFGRVYNIETRNAYKSINAIVQGGCAQILKISLIKNYAYINRIDPVNGKRISLINLVHDESVYEMPIAYGDFRFEILSKIRYNMEHIEVLEDMGIILRVEPQVTTTSWEQKHALSTKEEKLEQEYYKKICG